MFYVRIKEQQQPRQLLRLLLNLNKPHKHKLMEIHKHNNRKIVEHKQLKILKQQIQVVRLKLLKGLLLQHKTHNKLQQVMIKLHKSLKRKI